MNFFDYGIDPARLAACAVSAADCFNAFGGWNTLGPLMMIVTISSVLVYKYGSFVRYYGAYYLKDIVTLGPFWRWRESRRMNRAEEKRRLELAADIITDAFEKAHFDNPEEVSFEMKQELFKMIGKRCGMLDLVRRGEETVKDDIIARRAAEPRDVEGKIIPSPLPDIKKEMPKPNTKLRTVEIL